LVEKYHSDYVYVVERAQVRSQSMEEPLSQVPKKRATQAQVTLAQTVEATARQAAQLGRRAARQEASPEATQAWATAQAGTMTQAGTTAQAEATWVATQRAARPSQA
jgi:hypothetical protein